MSKQSNLSNAKTIGLWLFLLCGFMAALFFSSGNIAKEVCYSIAAVSGLGLVVFIVAMRKQSQLVAETPAEACSICGVALTSFNRAMGAGVCRTCVDGESAGMKLTRLLARMLGALVALGGLTALPKGLPAVILGVFAVYFGYRKPKPAPNSIQAKALEQSHYQWFDSLPNLTEDQIRAIPMQATNGLLFVRVAIVLAGVFIGAAVGGPNSFAVSLLGCFAGIALTGPIFARANPLDKARWRRFWNGLLLGYWPAYFASFFVSASSPHLNPFGVAFVCASVVGIIVGFSNVKLRDQQDKNVVIQYFKSKQPSA